MPTTVNGVPIKNIQDYILSGQPHSIGINSSVDSSDDIAVSSHAYIDDNDVYHSTVDVNTLLSNLEEIENIINYHETYVVPKYRIKRDYYKGRHHTIIDKQPTELGKADNRRIVNLPKKLVDTFNGFFIGDPVQFKYVSSDDGTTSKQDDSVNQQISDWCNNNNITDMLNEYAKTADIYGRAYLRAYLIDGKVGINVLTPRDTILVYDNTVSHTPLFAITYSKNSVDLDGWIITQKTDYHFRTTHGIGSNGSISIVNTADELDSDGNALISQADQHPDFNTLPVFELPENNERIGIFDNVISLIDSVDDIVSSKNNDIDSISNGILVVSGVELTQEQIENVKTMHVLNLYQPDGTMSENTVTPKAEYVTPDINDDMQEHMLDRAIDQVYQSAQVVNMNDSKFGASATSISGIALKQRYQDMMGKAETKATKMDSALRGLFNLLFGQWNINADTKYLKFNHKQSIPHNILEEAQTVTQLDGQVTDETKLSALSIVKDPVAEQKALKQQEEDNGNSVKNLVNNAIKNSGNASGDNDDNNKPSEE